MRGVIFLFRKKSINDASNILARNYFAKKTACVYCTIVLFKMINTQLVRILHADCQVKILQNTVLDKHFKEE